MSLMREPLVNLNTERAPFVIFRKSLTRFAFSHPRSINFVYASRDQRLQNSSITKQSFVILKLLQPLHINILQRCSIVAMVAHEAAFDAGEVERLVILVVVIFGA